MKSETNEYPFKVIAFAAFDGDPSDILKCDIGYFKNLKDAYIALYTTVISDAGMYQIAESLCYPDERNIWIDIRTLNSANEYKIVFKRFKIIIKDKQFTPVETPSWYYDK